MKKIDPRQIRDCSARAKRTRLALGFVTQKAFCEASGVRYDLYTACERGQRRLSLDVALKIRDKLGIPLDWIYCGDDSRLAAALRAELRK